MLSRRSRCRSQSSSSTGCATAPAHRTTHAEAPSGHFPPRGDRHGAQAVLTRSADTATGRRRPDRPTALIDRASDTGEVVFTGPRSPSVARYLSRMRLGRVLTDLGVDHDLPVVRERRQETVLVELTAFTDSGDVGRLAAMVHDTLEPTDQGAAGILYTGVVEAGDNVPWHARRPTGFLAAQKTGAARDLLFAVADGGVGVLGTLQGRGARDAAHALDLAVMDGVTERSDEGSMTGLHAVATELTRCGGYLHVLSGDAHLTVGRFVTRGTASQSFDGTAVQGLVRSARWSWPAHHRPRKARGCCRCHSGVPQSGSPTRQDSNDAEQ